MSQLEKATLAGGCFWCLEAVYVDVIGVESVVSGYTGGEIDNPTYKAICTGTTGHAEVVQITFDPAQVSYKQLLEIFFTIHDPTTLNRQGNDVGTQYRSAIYTHDDSQKEMAEAVIAEISELKLYPDPIVTEVEPLGVLYPAEDYHQDYYANNQYQPYCMFVVAPKVSKFRQKFAGLRKSAQAA